MHDFAANRFLVHISQALVGGNIIGACGHSEPLFLAPSVRDFVAEAISPASGLVTEGLDLLPPSFQFQWRQT
jgi:hypothetical protein